MNSNSGSGFGFGEIFGVVRGQFTGTIVIAPVLDFPQPSEGEIGSLVYDVTAEDEDGNEIEFKAEAMLCLTVDDVNRDDSCLAYLDENSGDWLCEDRCLDTMNDQLCGDTDHFTNFAVLFDGIASGGNPCGETPNPYIFDELWKDLVLLVSFVGFAICCFLFVILASYCQCCSFLLLGASYQRKQKKIIIQNEEHDSEI